MLDYNSSICGGIRASLNCSECDDMAHTSDILPRPATSTDQMQFTGAAADYCKYVGWQRMAEAPREAWSMKRKVPECGTGGAWEETINTSPRGGLGHYTNRTTCRFYYLQALNTTCNCLQVGDNPASYNNEEDPLVPLGYGTGLQ